MPVITVLSSKWPDVESRSFNWIISAYDEYLPLVSVICSNISPLLGRILVKLYANCFYSLFRIVIQSSRMVFALTAYHYLNLFVLIDTNAW